jgi:hypothetical protein
MPRPQIKPEIGSLAVQKALLGESDQLGTAVRYSLQLLEAKSQGKSVEVRVPPFAAIQCIAGPIHRRGTPANVVECPPQLWLELCSGRLSWSEALASGKLLASGNRAAEIADLLPLFN